MMMGAVMSDFELNKLCKAVPVLHAYALPNNVVDESGKLLVLEQLLKSKLARVCHDAGPGGDWVETGEYRWITCSAHALSP